MHFQKGKSHPRLMIAAASTVTGIVAALTAVAYRQVLTLADSGRVTLFALTGSGPKIGILFLVLAALGLIAGRITKSEPIIRGSGIPQVEGQLLGYFSPGWLPVLLKKFTAGAICILGGLSLGREGPSIQLGAMAAQGYAECTHQRADDKKYLIICGASAGLAAAFNAPLAGVLFALEEVHKGFSSRVVFPAMLAALSADIVSELFYGTNATLNFQAVDTLPIRWYIMYIVAGVTLGAFGALYNKTLFATQKLYKKIAVSDTYKLIIPFMFAGLFGLLVPEILGGGHGILHSLSAGDIATGTILTLLVLKFAFSMISFCSGAPGGIFFPLLVLGALTGALLCKTFGLLLGFPDAYMMNLMLLGMAGMFAGIVRAPLTGIVLVAEMSGSLTQFIGLAIVSCLACLTAQLLKSPPVYEQMLKNMVPDKAMDEGDEETVMLTADIPSGVRSDGAVVRDIERLGDCQIVSVLRRKQSLIVSGETVIHSGDMLVIACASGTENDVRKVLGTEGSDESEA